MFDELTELEIIELTDKKNELLNKLEANNEGLVHLSDDELADIQDEINNIYEQLDMLY